MQNFAEYVMNNSSQFHIALEARKKNKCIKLLLFMEFLGKPYFVGFCKTLLIIFAVRYSLII